jgi:hypothetical protein
MDLPIEFEDVADEENEQEFNQNQSKMKWVSVKVIVIAAHALEVNKY